MRKEYNFNEHTLLHFVLCNPYLIESILTNGILSYNEAQKRNVSYARNYFGYNFDDYISMIKREYTDYQDDNSAYLSYANKGVSFIVENQDYIYDVNEMYFNHADEVFVKDYVPTSNIKGILIPHDYLNCEIKDLPIIHTGVTSYDNIKKVSSNILNYLKSYNFNYREDEYQDILSYMKKVLLAYQKTPNDKELLEEFTNIKHELDDFLGEEINECFKKVLNKDTVTLYDMVSFINSKTLNLPIYEINSYGRKR